MLRLSLYLLSIITLAYTQKVDITSTQMEANATKKEIVFLGSAKITQGDSWIVADRIVVYFNDDNKTKSYNAKGSVKFEFIQKKSHYKGRAKEVLYIPIKQKYIIKGNAVIDDIANKREIKGNEIVLDMATGNANVKGSRRRPVKFIFEVESKR